MSKAVNSPTARLLQTSRLFSLPRPLPQPDLATSTSAGLYKTSTSATQPYPTHQAITTPSSSLSRGDWGLKRPLPAKTTKNTSTPHIRVRAQDNFAHITDFGSAADHTQTQAKWAEMGIPMLTQPPLRSREAEHRQVSVYENWLDITDPEAMTTDAPAAAPSREQLRRRVALPQAKPKQRWKYGGPWIAGMQDGEFQEYVTESIARRKDEWRAFLKTRIEEIKLREAQRKARESGTPLSEINTEQLEADSKMSDEDLAGVEKDLRSDHAKDKLNSNLTILITEFLDLPPMNTSTIANRDIYLGGLQKLVQTLSSENGPPSTHPGAGLSHLRTNAIMENHPIHGPQAHRTPVLGRVVRPRTSAAYANEYQAKIGVGGVVANDSESQSFSGGNQNRSNSSGQVDKNLPDPSIMAHQLDTELKGGNKIWVHPDSAYVDEKGAIRLQLKRADKEAVAVKTGDVDPIHEAKRASRSSTTAPGQRGYAAMPSPPSSRGGPGGYGLPQTRKLPGVTGFDEELGRRPQQGQVQGMSEDMIRDMFERSRQR